MRSWLAFAALALASACSPAREDAPGAEGAAGAAATPTVELGIPGGADGLDFAPLSEGDELRLQTFGQGGTHVLVAVRCVGFGNRAFVSAKLENMATGVVVEEPAPARPQLLYCEDEVCELVPYLVHASGLTETDDEKDGLRVRITAQVRTEAGVRAEGSSEAVLSTADL